jgi:hypothetical protein
VNLHHAAALALVGWYLMCPPLQSPCWPGVETLRELFGKGPGACEDLFPNYDATLSQWQESGQFDRIDECHDVALAKNEDVPLANQIQCRCIATDDPRLKEK